MSRKMLGIILIVGGALAALAAVVLGLVGFPNAGFGNKKIALLVFGVVIAAIGIGISMVKGTTPAAK